MLHKYKNMIWKLFCSIIAIVLIPLNLTFAKESNNKNDDEKDIKVFIGYSLYKMEEFNSKLHGEGNKEIDGGLNVGLEFSVISTDKDLPVVKIPIKMKLPIVGIEYLEANSETDAYNGRPAIKWTLPVLGAYLSIADIELASAKKRDNREGKFYLYWRPINIGLYNLGDIIDAKLTISNVPGSYNALDSTVGFSTELKLKYYVSNSSNKDNSKVFISIDGGYRRLKFTDVELKPEGGYTIEGKPAQTGTLPESLDYSGYMIKAELGIEF